MRIELDGTINWLLVLSILLLDSFIEARRTGKKDMIAILQLWRYVVIRDARSKVSIK